VDPTTTARLRRLLDLTINADIACWELGPDGWKYRNGLDLQDGLLRGGSAGGE